MSAPSSRDTRPIGKNPLFSSSISARDTFAASWAEPITIVRYARSPFCRRLRAYRRHTSLLPTSNATSRRKTIASLPEPIVESPPAPSTISRAAPTDVAPITRRISSGEECNFDA